LVYRISMVSKIIKTSQLNLKNNLNYNILWVNDIVKYTNINISNIWDIKEWAKIRDFKMKWDLTIHGSCGGCR
jgi:hypothetical protein